MMWLTPVGDEQGRFCGYVNHWGWFYPASTDGEMGSPDALTEPMPSKAHTLESEVKAEASGAGGDSQP